MEDLPRSRRKRNPQVFLSTLGATLLITTLLLLSQVDHSEAAACKGCAPPCVCPGTKGEKGISGFPGERGFPGVPGLDGPEGALGAVGMVGSEGDYGDAGPKGQGRTAYFVWFSKLIFVMVLRVTEDYLAHPAGKEFLVWMVFLE
uniref:Uncharacterized protein n=1 Tax=Ditylenchus dipsaci TaxID=166011 RepID=A0A915DL50_9BILA